MDEFQNIFSTQDELERPYLKVYEVFKLNVGDKLKGLGYRIESFLEIIDLVNGTKYFSISIDETDLNFQDRNGLIEVLIKFVDRKISNIPDELEALEEERHSRDFNDYRHFYDTESLSEKEGKLTKLKSMLLKEFKKKIK